MYKVLIVDDETWVVKSLRMAVDWNAQGFEVIGSATDGVEALSRIEELLPDLVVTDIRMPVMGGLELMEKARERWPLLQFVIISVHAEFEYARKAIECGAAGYCLKPADEQELAEMLKKVKARIEAQQTSGLDMLIFLEESGNRAEIIQFLADKGILWDGSGMKVICGASGAVTGKISLQKKSDLYLVAKAELPLAAQPPAGTSWGISADVGDPLRISEAVVEAQTASKQYFMTGMHGIYEYTTHSGSCLRARISAIASAVKDNNDRDAKEELDALLLELQSKGYNIKHAYQCFIRLCDVLDMQQTIDQDYELGSYQELVQSFPDLQAMFVYLQEQFHKQVDIPHDSVTATHIIENIVSYLNENYAREITLTAISERFHLNPSYLCRIFKRKCGKTLTGYLVDLRLRKACQMLRSTDQPVNTIAKKCGYEDYFYFARLFKRTLGMSPTQYREGMPEKVKIIHIR